MRQNTVQDLVDCMSAIAPTQFAESWDRVGLLVGDRARPLTGKVFLTIDLTPAVLDEAIAAGAGAIVAYHPPIWEPLKQVTADTVPQHLILRAIEAGIAIYSPHTALDAVPGGLADWLCSRLSDLPADDINEDRLALGDCRALTPLARSLPSAQVKITTFVGPGDVDKLRQSLATAGAGIIGDYQLCSFEVQGHGTFMGSPGTKPTVGQAGKFERVAEVRLEMVCSKAALALAIETLRRFHPYETPAIDVHELLPHPDRSVGPGRRLALDHETTVTALASRLRTNLGGADVRFALAWPDRPVARIGVCPGSGSSLVHMAIQAQCEVFVTGEMSHHDVLAAIHAGVSIIMAGHTATERGYLPRLAAKIRKGGITVPVQISKMDRDPLQVVV